jgi:hypothetical protein
LPQAINAAENWDVDSFIKLLRERQEERKFMKTSLHEVQLLLSWGLFVHTLFSA